MRWQGPGGTRLKLIASVAYFQRDVQHMYSIGDACGLGLTGWCGRSWNRLGERMAGAKKRRKMKLLTAVYLTSWSTRDRET